jgi:predicted dehydrogenase
VLGPVRGRLAERIGLVVAPPQPEEVTAAGEAPLTVDPHVPVVILDELLNQPLALALALARRSAVVDEPVGPDGARGVVDVIELDEVIGDEQHGHPDLCERGTEERPGGRGALTMGTEPGVGPVERRQQVEVATVDGIGVAVGETANLVSGDQLVEWVHLSDHCTLLGSSVSSGPTEPDASVRLVDIAADTDAATDPESVTCRFAVIGVDHPHAIVLTAGLVEAGADCIGWVDSSGEDGAAFATLFPDLTATTLDAALAARPDLVVIAAVPQDRARVAIAAMHAGADVLVAKPGATDLVQLAEVEQASAATGRRWWVGFTEHFTSRAVIRADAVVASGRIGNVRHVLGIGPHRRGQHRPDWFADAARSGSMIADLASHQIHHACRLLGTTELTVIAARTTPAAGGTHPQMLGELMLEGGTGSAYIRVDWLTPDGLSTWGDVRLMITGDAGTVEVRANCDPGGAPGADHLIVVDRAGVERIDCTANPLTWASTVIDDVRSGSERLISTTDSFAVTRLALTAAAMAGP